MDEEVTGLLAREAAAPEESRLAERLIHDEFAQVAHAHRPWFHRDGKEPVPGGERVSDDTTTVPVVVAAAAPEASPKAIHEEFAEPARPPRFRSHRAGMLAGLAVVGALLAVLVLLAPGSGKPRLPAQSVHDVSPISASGPKTAAATTPSTAAPSTTSSAPGSTTTTTTAQTQPHQSVTPPTTVTYVYQPGTTTAPAETVTTSAPVAPPTTSPPPPPTTTTTTTSPPTTTSTTSCLLVICN